MTTSTFPVIAHERDFQWQNPLKRLFKTQTSRELNGNDPVAAAVTKGLSARQKNLPPWLFYDRLGSQLFDEITERPEYYLTRTERVILTEHADAMIDRAANGNRLRLTELGAGSAEKTRLLLRAAVHRQGNVTYEPLDVSASALDVAKSGIEHDIPAVKVIPKVMDYTRESKSGSSRKLPVRRRRNRDAGLEFDSLHDGERRLVLYIGSSIGNFDPPEAMRVLRRIRAGLSEGDGLLLGTDLVKDKATLLSAYDDFAGVTADFNLNMLARLNRELDAEFLLDSFEHRAVWNAKESRIEMHLESRCAQKVQIAALKMEVNFAKGETIHTECSYKYAPGQAETMLKEAGFANTESWTDERRWFNVCLARA